MSPPEPQPTAPGAKTPGGGPHADGPQAVAPMNEAQKEAAYRQFELKMRVQETLQRIGTVLCVMSGKGGVGKSTVAVNLAVALARAGKATGLGDFDLTNPNDPTMLGLKGRHMEAHDESFVKPVQARENLSMVSTGFLVEGEAPIAWRGPIKMGVMRQFLADIKWPELDVLVVDLPPGTSDEALSVAQTFPRGTPCLMVTTPQETSSENVRQNVKFCVNAGMEVLGIVENYAWMQCPHCDERLDVFPGAGAAAFAGELDLEVLAQLPLDPDVGRSQDAGVPAVEMDPPNPTGQALVELAELVAKRLEL